ncbi:WD40 repeat domain-containing protein [Deinococcus arcticus]|nr:WD40 repeat domain-containing protein [Deinococcus arcticus]
MKPKTSLSLALLLGTALSLGSVASALSLSDPKVYTVPGANTRVAAFLPGGQVAVNADNGVLILDQNLKTVRSWYTLPDEVTGLVSSPNGARVAAMTSSRWAVWDAVTGREVRGGQSVYDTRLGFDAQGELLLQDDGTLYRVNIASGQRQEVLGDGELYDMAVSPDGTLLVALYEDRVELVRLSSGEVLAKAPVEGEPYEVAATFAPSGEAAVVRLDEQALVLRAGQAPTALEDGEDLSQRGSVVFLNPQQFVYALYGDGQLYDAQSGKMVGDPLEFDSAGPLVAGPDGTVLALGRAVGRLSTANLSAPARPQVNLPSSNALVGAFVGGVPHAGVAEFINLKTGTALNVGSRGTLWAAEATGDSVWTLGGVTVNVYRAGKITRVGTLDEDAEYETLRATPGGQFAAASGYYGAALLDGRSGKVLGKVTETQLKVEDIHGALPTLDGKGLIITPHEGDPFRYDLASKKRATVFKLPAEAEVYDLHQSPGGTLAVLYGTEDDDRVALVKPGATTAFKTLTFPGSVRALRFSPDGKLLAVLTGDAQNALQVYDTATGAVLARAGSFSLRTSLLVWNPGGTELLVGSGLLGQSGSATVYTVRK